MKILFVKILQKYPDLLISRGGQEIKTLENIEKPKDMLRKEYNEQIETIKQELAIREKQIKNVNPL